MAATDVPDLVQHLLEVLVGNDWPEGDPGELRRTAERWRATATDVGAVSDLVRDGARRVDRALLGRTRESFDEFAAPFVADSGYPDTLRRSCLALADALDEMAVQIEMLRIIIIELLVVLAVQILAEIAAAPFTFGASLANIPLEMAATRAVLVTVLRRAVVGLVSHLAASQIEQVGVVFLAQFVLVCRHELSGFRSATFTSAALNGAVGGAVGLGMGALGNVVKGAAAGALRERAPVARHLGDVPPASWRSAGAHLAVNAPLDVGWGAATGAAEAAAQDAAAGASGDEVYGAENGAFTGARDAAHRAVNPRGRFAAVPTPYIERALNHPWDRARPVVPGPPRAGEGIPPSRPGTPAAAPPSPAGPVTPPAPPATPPAPPVTPPAPPATAPAQATTPPARPAAAGTPPREGEPGLPPGVEGRRDHLPVIEREDWDAWTRGVVGTPDHAARPA